VNKAFETVLSTTTRWSETNRRG